MLSRNKNLNLLLLGQIFFLLSCQVIAESDSLSTEMDCSVTKDGVSQCQKVKETNDLENEQTEEFKKEWSVDGFKVKSIDQILPEGIYSIRVLHSNLSIGRKDMEDNKGLYQLMNQCYTRTEFRFMKLVGEGHVEQNEFMIENEVGSQSITIALDETASPRLFMSDWENTKSQIWQIIASDKSDAERGVFYLNNLESGYRLNINMEATNMEVDVLVTKEKSNTGNQEFLITLVRIDDEGQDGEDQDGEDQDGEDQYNEDQYNEEYSNPNPNQGGGGCGMENPGSNEDYSDSNEGGGCGMGGGDSGEENSDSNEGGGCGMGGGDSDEEDEEDEDNSLNLNRNYHYCIALTEDGPTDPASCILNHHFRFIQTDSDVNTFEIILAYNPNKVITMDPKNKSIDIQEKSKDLSNFQEWKLIEESEGKFMIQNLQTKKYLIKSEESDTKKNVYTFYLLEQPSYESRFEAHRLYCIKMGSNLFLNTLVPDVSNKSVYLTHSNCSLKDLWRIYPVQKAEELYYLVSAVSGYALTEGEDKKIVLARNDYYEHQQWSLLEGEQEKSYIVNTESKSSLTLSTSNFLVLQFMGSDKRVKDRLFRIESAHAPEFL